eukprot:CAMPEP_0173438248 /NCGR_PEP_ID=MMETSP1357-20121228/19821_1 /TAXON_ID=77926 /ORGANISM="Hemiselmis rufescens, Strain PCC563" /LENGTH=59 /DNA_ID=CAMNT_0014403519 /DNA_START=151 /DNA_END=327 /DNA_ORIENTATION=-
MTMTVRDDINPDTAVMPATVISSSGWTHSHVPASTANPQPLTHNIRIPLLRLQDPLLCL